MKRPLGFHPEVPLFPLPIDGGGKGGGDHILKFNDFLFHYPSPPRGEGVSGSVRDRRSTGHG